MKAKTKRVGGYLKMIATGQVRGFDLTTMPNARSLVIQLRVTFILAAVGLTSGLGVLLNVEGRELVGLALTAMSIMLVHATYRAHMVYFSGVADAASPKDQPGD